MADDDKKLFKAFIIPPQFRRTNIGGQSPDVAAENRRLVAMMEKAPPKTVTAEMMFATPTLSINHITENLGFDQREEKVWNEKLSGILHGSTNELVMRKALFQTMAQSKLPHEKRAVMFQRSMGYYKDRVKKSMVEVVTPDALLQKSGERGGKYFKRSSYTSKDGKTKHRYFYSEDDYKKSKGAHVSGEEAEGSYINKQVMGAVEKAGKNGCALKSLQPLVKKYGAKKVGAMLKQSTSGGQLQYKRGKLYKGASK